MRTVPFLQSVDIHRMPLDHHFSHLIAVKPALVQMIIPFQGRASLQFFSTFPSLLTPSIRGHILFPVPFLFVDGLGVF